MSKEPKLVLLAADAKDDHEGDGIDLTGPSWETFNILQRALDMYIDYPLDKTQEAQTRRRQALKLKTDFKNARVTYNIKLAEWHRRNVIGGRKNGTR